MPLYSRSGYDITPLLQEQLEPLLANLDTETLRITQKAGTEQPFCGTLLDNKKDGFYRILRTDTIAKAETLMSR